MDTSEIGGAEGDQTGIGQGLAYVLPQSRSVSYFMQLANEKAQQRRDDAAALAAQQQKANEAYANHLYQYKTPEIANEYTKWLQPKFDDLLNKAADYHSSTGQDPFTNPDFVRQTNDLNTVAKSTAQANTRATAIGTALADKSKNYTPESKQANIDWLQKYHSDPVGSLYQAPPPLQERNLDLNDAVKLGHPIANEVTQGGYNVTTPNRHSHIVQGQEILGQPEFSPYLQSRGINPTVGDIGGQPNGHGGTIYPTDTPTVNAIADHILQNANQPHYAATLQAAGIDPLDPHAKDKLTAIVQNQNAGYGKVYGDFADRLDAGIGSKKVRNTSEDMLALSEERLRLAQEKQAKQAQPTYVQNQAEQVRNRTLTGLASNGVQGMKNPLPELENLYTNNPSFRHTLAPIVNPDGTLTLNVPAEYKTDAKIAVKDDDGNVVPNSDRVKIRDGYQVKLDPNNPEQFNTTYGDLFDKVTGEKTGQASKINTLGGKGHLPVVPGQGGAHPQGKVATMQQIQSKVGKPGFEGYSQQELIDYYKAQGYTIK